MSNNIEKIICLSVKDKDLDPSKNTKFSTSFYDVSSLKDVFINHSYSPICWKNTRLQENFLSATGFVIDIDTGLSIREAETILTTANLNYALITSQSHTPASPRFHILIPFKRTVYTVQDYRRVVQDVKNRLFPACDPQVLEPARYMNCSPIAAEYSDNWRGQDYDPDANLAGPYVPDAWDDNLEVITADQKFVSVRLLKEKTPIRCPFHEDKHHSAFITPTENKKSFFIHCSACNKTFWKVPLPLKDRCANYWSHGTEVLEFGVTGEAFFMSAIGKDKFLLFMDAIEKEDRLQTYRYLLDHKHIPHLKIVNHISDMRVQQTGYLVDTAEGKITVHYAPVAVKVQDNQFIEDYLDKKFGKYKDFIEQWLAVYCYTNYRDLPTLIFKGARGNGKNTFAEMVYSIFPTMSLMWEAEKGNFTPEGEQKCLIADETVSDNPEQYKLLKQYAGMKYVPVNKKYLPKYMAQNNMNIIILSNSAIPIYVARDEKPTSESNNQFFVYNFPPFEGPIDPDLDQKLEDRIGHYVRTELKYVFEKIEFNGNRYSIKTPITDAEAGLFESNMTEEESVAEKMVDKIVTNAAKATGPYEKFLAQSLVPAEIISDSIAGSKIGIQKVFKTLREEGYLEMTESEKKQIDKDRYRCYQMTEKLKQLIEEEQKSNKSKA